MGSVSRDAHTEQSVMRSDAINCRRDQVLVVYVIVGVCTVVTLTVAGALPCQLARFSGAGAGGTSLSVMLAVSVPIAASWISMLCAVAAPSKTATAAPSALNHAISVVVAVPWLTRSTSAAKAAFGISRAEAVGVLVEGIVLVALGVAVVFVAGAPSTVELTGTRG